MPRLSQEEKVTIKVLNSENETNRAIARRLGVSKGTVRYHLRKVREGREEQDGRREKIFKAQEVADQIEHWMKAAESEQAEGLPVNLKLLWQWLVDSCGYAGSYKSVWRYVRKQYPCPAKRPYRRVELPPGLQAQVDWCERTIPIAGIPVKLYGFCMSLSHSRAERLIWRESMDQLSWQESHNLAFVGLGGIPATVRIDNLKTGMAVAGPNGTVNPVYQRYAYAAGFHVDACPVRHPEAKGKVESRIGHLVSAFLCAHAGGFSSVEELQGATDAWIERQSQRRRCPATGTSVAEAREAERALRCRRSLTRSSPGGSTATVWFTLRAAVTRCRSIWPVNRLRCAAAPEWSASGMKAGKWPDIAVALLGRKPREVVYPPFFFFFRFGKSPG